MVFKMCQLKDSIWNTILLLAGLLQVSCSLECSSFCIPPADNETDICDSTTGECLYGCAVGYAGSNCTTKCPDNCAASSSVDNADVCDATSKECMLGCNEGFFGTNCIRRCSDVISYCKRCSFDYSAESDTVTCDECMDTFHQQNGKCIPCSYYCKIVDGTPSCRESDGYCNHGCRDGNYGFRCGTRCSPTCYGACHRETGHCLTGCRYPSYCGPTCQIECHDGCVSQNCNQSCTCTKGCIRTRWGEQCGESCNTNCNEPLDSTSNICERLTGTCTNGCKNMTHWGNDCGTDCLPNCVGGVCQQDNGTCINGCSTDTVHGVGCNIPCDVNCLNESCERADGTCFGGCKSGYFGNQCTRKCNENCKDKACDRQTGRCLFGCINGYFNDTCNQRCNVVNIVNCVDATCDRKFGNCSCLSSYEGTRCERVKEAGMSKESESVSPFVLGGAICGWSVPFWLLIGVIVLIIRKVRLHKANQTHVSGQKGKTDEANGDKESYMTLQQRTMADNNASYYESLGKP